MIRFIDLTGQIDFLDDDKKSFAFFDTVTDRFFTFSDSQYWYTVEGFVRDYDFKAQDISRFLNLIPDSFKPGINTKRSENEYKHYSIKPKEDN